MVLEKTMLRYTALATIFLLAACGNSAVQMENFANRSTTSWALGKQYSRVAALGTTPLEKLSGEQIGFGPLIGSIRLADGTTLHRHIAPSSEANTSSDFGGLVGTSKKVSNYRLSYFKVGQDGVVMDWATGRAAGTVSDCLTFISGIIQRCSDQSRVQQTLVSYDAAVRTSSGSTLNAWGAAANSVVATN